MCQKSEIRGKKGEKRKRKSNGRTKKMKKNENFKGMGVEQTGEFCGIRTREKKGRKKTNKKK